MRLVGILLIITIIFLSSHVSPVSANEDIQIKGWKWMVPIIQDAAFDFMNAHPNVNITVAEAKNLQAIKELYDGTIDIALSRNIMDFQSQDITIDYSKLFRYPIGRTAVVIILNQANPVSNLTPLEIQRIYKGEITNWKEVGGADLPILTVGYFSRGKGTDARRIFFEKIMNMPDSSLQANRETDSEDEIVKIVAENLNTIAYSYYEGFYPEYKILALDMDGIPVYPSRSSVNDGSYPLSENLNIYTKGNPQGVVKDFIDYILSPEGQILVKSNGQIPIFETYLNEEVKGPITITQPGYYWLSTDIIRPPDIIDLGYNQSVVINIHSSDVVFDGMGHTIGGSNHPFSSAIVISNMYNWIPGHYGEFVNNVTIKNVILTNWYFGINADRVVDSHINYITAFSNQYAIFFRSGKNIVITNNSFNSNRRFGIFGVDIEQIIIRHNTFKSEISAIDLGREYRWAFPSLTLNNIIKILTGNDEQIFSYRFSGENNQISSNVIADTTRGVTIYKINDTIISNNSFSNGDFGIIFLNNGSNITDSNNSFPNMKLDRKYDHYLSIPSIIFSTIVILLASGKKFILDFVNEFGTKRIERIENWEKKWWAFPIKRILPLINWIQQIKSSFPRFIEIFHNTFVISMVGMGVFGLSFQYSHILRFDIQTILIFTFIGGIAIILHEVIHFYLAHRLAVEIEFRIWWVGIFITLLTAYVYKFVFGQPLLVNIPSEERYNKKLLAIVNLAGPLAGLVSSVIFILLCRFGGDLSNYGIIGMEISIMTALVSFIPVASMDGWYVYRWKRKVWAAIFFSMLIIFVLFSILSQIDLYL